MSHSPIEITDAKTQTIFDILNTAEIANYKRENGEEGVSLRICIDHDAEENEEYDYLEIGDMEAMFTFAEVEAATPCPNGGKSWTIKSNDSAYSVDFMALVTL